MISIYTDGSCLNNPGPGGWAILGIERKKITKISGGEANTTNNRMELIAVIEALRYYKEYNKYIIHTDSKLTINCAEGKWKRKKNLDLWEEYDSVSKYKMIVYKWVKGHSGNKNNEIVDKLARKAAQKVYKKNIS